MRLVTLLVCLLTVFLLPALAHSACTTTIGPGQSIARAAAPLQPGQTLCLASGTYRETLQDVIPGGTSWEQPVTIKAAPGATVILQAASPTSGAYAGVALVLSQPHAQYILFERLIFDGVHGTQGTVKITGGVGQTGAHHIRFLACEFRNAFDGVNVSHSHHNEFLGGSAHDEGGGDSGTGRVGHGLYFASEATDNLVAGMAIYQNGHYGIHNYDTALTANRNRYCNNTVHHNGVVSGSGCGILYAGGRDGVLSGNHVYANQGGGICVAHAGPAENILVVGNTVEGNLEHEGFRNIMAPGSALAPASVLAAGAGPGEACPMPLAPGGGVGQPTPLPAPYALRAPRGR